MGLFGKSKEQQELQDASEAITSIFSPSRVPYKSSSDNSGEGDKVFLFPHNANAELGSATAQGGRSWWRFWVSSTPSQNKDVASDSGEPAVWSSSRASSSTSSSTSSAPAANAAAVTTRWQDLPPCPISGYELTRKGLVDRLAQPRAHLLNTSELRQLLVELAGVEQRAKYTVDSQFAETVGSRGHHGLELFVNPCLFLTGIYLMTWKTAKLYREAVPRQSVLLTKCLALMRWSLPAAEQERVAQRHRRLMQATNARVTLSFLTGVFVFAVAVWTRPSWDVMETTPEVVQAKQSVAYQQHSERSLKWLWFVYYHHPAYAKEAKSLLTPALPPATGAL